MLLGIPLVIGRNVKGDGFALRDACPHRGMPLSEGVFDGHNVECPYHGWVFEGKTGQCQAIPSLTARDKLKVERVFATSFPCDERDGYFWVYIPDPEQRNEKAPPAPRLPRLRPRLLSGTMPECFPYESVATSFWQQILSALRLAERYVPLGPLDLYEVADGMHAEVLGSLVDGYGDVRFHASNGAIGSFLETVPLLHPLGSLVSHDLFVTDLAQYGCGFRGPGKYDGSVVNWVNGPLLQALAGRRGFHVEFSPFDHASRSPIATARARARD